MAVAESRAVAAVPVRPAWRDSDRRWRRRVLAGVWVLVLLPLMGVLQQFEWDSRIPVPGFFQVPHTVRMLDETFLSNRQLYAPLIFCVGVVLLFSKERGRRRGALDWTRRWGILCAYVTMLLTAAPILYICSLVLVGIGALFQAMPLREQPAATRLIVEVSSNYLRYGPQPRTITIVIVVAFSSVAVLFACASLFNGLRSSGSKRLAWFLVTPLACFALLHLVQAGASCASLSTTRMDATSAYGVYFIPELYLQPLANFRTGLQLSGWDLIAAMVELLKWLVIFTIAVWLSIAQFAAWRVGQGAIRRSASASRLGGSGGS